MTYQVTLINLMADAGTAGAESRIDHGRMSDAELRELLVNFCAIDAIEHATLEPEIRVQVRGESYVLRAGHRNLLLYDALNRAAPGQVVSVDEAMAELDGSAQAARTAMPWQKLGAASATEPAIVVPLLSPWVVFARRLAWSAIALVLLAAAAWVRFGWDTVPAEMTWSPLEGDDAAATRAAMAGVYVSGSEPGAHGLVVMATGEMRLFEFRGPDVPRVVYATYQPVRAGSTLALLTDQPGGAVVSRDRDTLRYCGETFLRVP